MAEGTIDSSQQFAAQIRNSLLKGFAIPVVLLVFYGLAPFWLNHNLHQSVAKDIDASALPPEEKARRSEAFGRIDFSAVCAAPVEGQERLQADLELEGICGQFRRLRWGLWLSVLLVTVLTGVTTANFALNRRAQRSRPALISAYRLAWRLSIAEALTKVLLLIPLLGYGTFELSTLAFGTYFPKLILIIVIGGVIALWRAAAILLKPVPMEFNEPMARSISSVEAPTLWDDVRRAATRLGTTPPDHILIGMQLNFYVTEMAVNYGRGRAEGRTLYLSLPLIRQLATEEVVAIIGHELGHFRGDDTRITREFYPLRHKAGATLQAISEAGWVGWPSLHTLLLFHWSFGRTEQAMSRERELVADRTAAELTSASVAARALIKVQVVSEAFDRSLDKLEKDGVRNVFATSLLPIIRDELAPQTEFWAGLFERKAPHPMDSHPSLRLRLESLQQPVDPVAALEIALTETDLAYEHWLEGRDDLFSAINDEATQRVSRIHTQRAMRTADYGSEAGRKLLEERFPEVQWKSRASNLWLKVVACIVAALVTGVFLIVVDDVVGKLMVVALSVFFLAVAVQQWRRHASGLFLLRVDSLSYTGWSKPLLFSDVANIGSVSSSGSITLKFHLHQRTDGFWRFSPLARVRTKTLSLPITLIAGKQAVVVETLLRYFTRQTETEG